MEEDDFDEELAAELERHIENLVGFYEELNGESPRAAAILAVSSLENELARLILKKFRRTLPEKTATRLFNPGGPFSSFKAKVDVAQAFGFYGSKTKTKLKLMAKVRNRFAHFPNVRRFIDREVLEPCVALHGRKFPNAHGSNSPNESDVRYFFITAVRELHEQLEDHADHIPELDRPLPPLP